MTIITLHNLCFGHFVKSSVIVLMPSGAACPKKNTSAQNNPPTISQNDLKKDGALSLLSNQLSTLYVQLHLTQIWFANSIIQIHELVDMQDHKAKTRFTNTYRGTQDDKDVFCPVVLHHGRLDAFDRIIARLKSQQ